jgi:ABC-type ATPase involved in cell division
MDFIRKETAVLITSHNYVLVRKAQGKIMQIKDRIVREVQIKQ